ncbi:MAG: DUF4190 domain-containing protein, partial [Solirubrobacterales bacterium]
MNDQSPPNPPVPPPPPTPPTAPPPGPAPAFIPPTPTDSSSKATTSLIFGIVGLLICPLICSIVALVTGYQAKSEIENSGGAMAGSGKA